MKDIKEQFAKLLTSNSKTNWAKSVFWAILICLALFICADVYLLFRPLASDVKGIIDDEVESVNINFDEKTLEGLRQKEDLSTPINLPKGKSPFTSL